MSFSLRDRIEYRGMEGMVIHVCERYIVMAACTHPGREYPRLLIFPERYKEVRYIREHKDDV